MWETILGAGASILGGLFGSGGANKAARIQAQAADKATALQRQIYTDQRQLLGPGYMTGGAATNKLAGLFGIAPQDYQAAYSGGLNSGIRFPGNPDALDYQLSLQTQTQPQAPTNPLADFYSSPYAQLATTLSNDQIDKIKGNLGAAGKSISGTAEGRYAKTLAGNTYGAFTDYTNQLSNLAGMGQTNSQLASNAAGNYGVNAGNLITQAGNAKANALQSGYQSMANGVNGALGVLNDYSKQQKWWG